MESHTNYEHIRQRLGDLKSPDAQAWDSMLINCVIYVYYLSLFGNVDEKRQVVHILVEFMKGC